MAAPFMLMLGFIRFSLDGPAYEQLQRTTQYTWAAQNRLGHPVLKHLGQGGPALQYIGPGTDTITLNGTIYPQYRGSSFDLTLMRLAAGLGTPLPLISLSGLLWGMWIIESVSETKSILFSDGAPRKIEFSMTLKRYHVNWILVP